METATPVCGMVFCWITHIPSLPFQGPTARACLLSSAREKSWIRQSASSGGNWERRVRCTHCRMTAGSTPISLPMLYYPKAG
jgi:hypothetical protein